MKASSKQLVTKSTGKGYSVLMRD